MAQTIKEILDKEKNTPEAGELPAPTSSQETVTIPLPLRETNLRTPDMKPLPPRSTVGRPSQLETLVHDMPDIYSEMIHDISRGSYWHVAAEAIGINESTFKLWLKNGRSDIASQTDSLYSRLYADVRRASAQARIAVEKSFALVNPAKWLARGPGRIFGEHWTEPVLGSGGKEIPQYNENQQDEIGEVISDETRDVETRQIAANKAKEDDYGMVMLQLTPEDELATLEAQESAGHIKVSEEYKNSLRSQIQKR